MNKHQAIYLNNLMKDYNTNVSKINEFNDKFFGDKGLFNENNEYRIKNNLQIGVYGKSGQSINIDIELLPEVIEFIKKLQMYYIEKNNNIKICDLTDHLQKLE